MKRQSLLAVLMMVAMPAWATGAELMAVPPGAQVIEGEYIVVFKDDVGTRPGTAGLTMAQVALGKAAAYGANVQHVYNRVAKGFAGRLSPKALEALLKDPDVAYVEQNTVVHALATQNNATWGLDRIDQRNRPLNSTYVFNFDGTGVHAYIIDTGIRGTHQQFTGRMGNGFTAINDGQGTNDCNGHGTHVAGTVGGSTWGVAKNVTLHAVRVLGCTGSGSNAGVIAGVDWVADNAIRPAVANMSLGGGISTATDNAVNAAVASGVTFAVAAGNSNANACNSSPARAASAITVGATTQTDARSSFSNFGTCVDIFAPGSGITSAWSTSNTATNTISGTSMASPHVAGVAALILDQLNGGSPSQVAQTMINGATTGVLSSIGTGSPNRLLFSLFGGAPNPTPTPGPTPTPTPPPPGGTIYFDDFNISRGWVRGTDTATTGIWNRDTPQQTSSGGIVLQPGNCGGGGACLVSGAAAGAGVGSNDIDNGVTVAISPTINLPGGTKVLSFSYFFGHLNNATSADFLRIRIGNTVVFQQTGQASNRAGTWTNASVNISAFSGSVQLIVEASDLSTGSLIEAGVDDVRISQ